MPAPQTTKAIKQYLQHYAVAEQQLADTLTQPYQHILALPAYNEYPLIKNIFAHFPQQRNGRVLVVLVINAHDHSPPAVIRNNQQSLAHFAGNVELTLCEDLACAYAVIENSSADRDILLIDKSSQADWRLSVKHGVGMARKIGADIALALYAQGKLTSPWIHCSDADVTLPNDYFSRADTVSVTKDTAALIYPFVHKPDENNPVLALAMALYDHKLRYHVAGLQTAGSPYAFQTIGSTMVLHTGAYAKVRGFPKRAAAEDFYVLNKLAKVGRVLELDGAPITIAGRLSDRVPFGTGAALHDLTDALDSEHLKESLEALHQTKLFYHPDVYVYLRAWLSCLPDLYAEVDADNLAILLANRLKEWTHNVDQYLGVNYIIKTICQHLLDLDLVTIVKRNRQHSRDQASFVRTMHEWFDAFRTLKFLHHLRDMHLPDVSSNPETNIKTSSATPLTHQK